MPFRRPSPVVLMVLDGGCDGRTAVLSDERPLRAGRNELLFNGGGRASPDAPRAIRPARSGTQ